MPRRLKAHAWCIDGILDVDWDISPIEDMFFIRDAQINGTSYMEQLKHLSKNCLAKIDPEFSQKVKAGDFLIGHRGVGWGHGHDHAALAIKALGICAVICETTSINFKRNCINHGLPLIEVPGIFSKVKTGDELELDLNTGVLQNLSNGLSIRFAAYPEFILKILDAGGIYEQMRLEIENRKIPVSKNEAIV
jgi:3-isopropylmalate/(R)-2-methylmalate dehydratase small subunit